MTTAAFDLRPFASGDRPPLLALLQDVWGSDRTTIAYYRFGEDSPLTTARFLRTLVAESGQRVVGFGSLWTNPMHPTSLYVGIVVHPAFQARGIGTAIYSKLLQQRGAFAELPLQSATWEGCTPAVRFLTQHHFAEDKCTYLPLLELSDVPAALHERTEEQCAAAGYQIVSLAEFAPHAERNAKVATLAAEVYRATHISNPPAARTPTEWEALLFNELIEPGCYVALKDSEMVGITFLHPHEQPDTLWFGWRGVAAAYRHDEQLVLTAMVARELQYAREHGFRNIQAEIDTTDPWAMLLWDVLPLVPGPAWVTFRTQAGRAS